MFRTISYRELALLLLPFLFYYKITDIGQALELIISGITILPSTTLSVILLKNEKSIYAEITIPKQCITFDTSKLDQNMRTSTREMGSRLYSYLKHTNNGYVFHLLIKNRRNCTRLKTKDINYNMQDFFFI